jgi:hypothetical protein
MNCPQGGGVGGPGRGAVSGAFGPRDDRAISSTKPCWHWNGQRPFLTGPARVDVPATRRGAVDEGHPPLAKIRIHPAGLSAAHIAEIQRKTPNENDLRLLIPSCRFTNLLEDAQQACSIVIIDSYDYTPSDNRLMRPPPARRPTESE